jgi:arginyl-tRNA synthetase
MEEKIIKILVDNAVELFGTQIDEQLIQFQKTRKEVEGDLTLVIFPFVKWMKCSPMEAGEKIGECICKEVKQIESYQVVSGFLNLVVSADYWIEQLNSIQLVDKFGFEKENSKPLVMVEYSSPNTNKPLHLGHLRNNFLGYSVAEILKAYGHKVIKTQVINDRGIHICKSMLAWEKFSPLNEKGERETPANTGLKGDKLVGKYYVEFDKQFNNEAKEIIASWESGNFNDFKEEVQAEFNRLTSAKIGKDEKAVKGLDDKIKELAKNQTTLLQEAKEMLVKWEARDPQVYLLWTTMNNWVYEGFEVTYDAMGVNFDKLYYESETFLLGKDIVLDGLNKGVFFKKEDGSVWIDLTADGLDEKLVLRADGTAVYMTQDIGTAVDRFNDYSDLNSIIYTVGNEQDYHFKVLFLILEKMGYAWANNCAHLSYGMVELPKGMGRMKSREGTVVDADELMAEVVEGAAEMTRERGHLEGMFDQDKNNLFTVIGMGGLKYFLLKVDPKKKMIFDPKESVELNGNTGPFIQYTYARIKSLLAKAKIEKLEPAASGIPLQEVEKEIIKVLADFPAVLKDAALEQSPAIIANYTYNLVKTYNHFYQAVPILIEPDANSKYLRLVLSDTVSKVIKSAMGLLGIEVPERM